MKGWAIGSWTPKSFLMETGHDFPLFHIGLRNKLIDDEVYEKGIYFIIFGFGLTFFIYD